MAAATLEINTNNTNSIISFNIADSFNDTKTINKYSHEHFSDDLYLMISHGESGSKYGSQPFELQPNEQIIMPCIDGCTMSANEWDIAKESLDPSNPEIPDSNYKKRIIDFINSDPDYNTSLCVYEGDGTIVPNIMLSPYDDEDDRMGLFQMPLQIRLKHDKIQADSAILGKKPNINALIQSNIITLKNGDTINTNDYLDILSYKKYDNWNKSSIKPTWELSQIVREIRKRAKHGFALFVFSCRVYAQSFSSSKSLKDYTHKTGLDIDNLLQKDITNYMASNNYKLRTTKNNIRIINKLKNKLKNKNHTRRTIKNSGTLLAFKKYLLRRRKVKNIANVYKMDNKDLNNTISSFASKST